MSQRAEWDGSGQPDTVTIPLSLSSFTPHRPDKVLQQLLRFGLRKYGSERPQGPTWSSNVRTSRPHGKRLVFRG